MNRRVLLRQELLSWTKDLRRIKRIIRKLKKELSCPKRN